MEIKINKKNYLSTKEKTKFIELIILIGTIIGTFNIPIEIQWMFILFLILALFNYILVSKNNTSKFLIFLMSVLFSGLIFYSYGISILSINEFLVLKLIILFLFYLLLISLIYLLLTKNNNK